MMMMVMMMMMIAGCDAHSIDTKFAKLSGYSCGGKSGRNSENVIRYDLW